MTKQTFILAWIILSAIKIAACINPLASIDEATNLLENLDHTVLGYIAVGKLQVGDLMFDIETFRNNVNLRGQFDLMEHDQRMKTQLTHIKNGGVESKKNITACLIGEEDRLENMVLEFYDLVDNCISALAPEAQQIEDAGIYRIDIYRTNVMLLQFQLNQCESMSNNESCLLQLIERLKTQVTAIPLEIQVEVQDLEDQVELHKAQIQLCANKYVSDFANAATEVIINVATCVNQES